MSMGYRQFIGERGTALDNRRSCAYPGGLKLWRVDDPIPDAPRADNFADLSRGGLLTVASEHDAA